jgi:hypothetical protein
LQIKLTALEQKHADRVYETKTLMHQNNFYEKFLLERLKAVEIGEMLEPVILNHILCNTPNGLKWLGIPPTAHCKEVSFMFLDHLLANTNIGPGSN